MESFEVVEKAIRHITDLSFDSAKWDLSDVVCERKSEGKEAFWSMLKRSDGTVVTYGKSFKLHRDVWYFYLGLSLVESADESCSWHLINDAGSILITFCSGFPNAYEKVEKADQVILTLAMYLDLLKCHSFILSSAGRKLGEHNYGFSKEAVEQKGGRAKCRFHSDVPFQNSCDLPYFQEHPVNKAELFSFCYDEVWDFHDVLGVCIVVNNNKAAFINRWFYRISPWFDSFVDDEELNEMYGRNMSASPGFAVRIKDEIVFLKFAGNFIKDKFLNPLVFFDDQERAKEMYPNTVFPLDLDDIFRVKVEEDFGLSFNKEQILLLPEFRAIVERNGLNRAQVLSYVEEHNKLLGVVLSGCKILKRIPYLRYQKHEPEGRDKVKISPYTPKHKINPKFYYSFRGFGD